MTTYAVTLDGNDITADVLSVTIQLGGQMDPFHRVARVGTCVLLLNNDARTYSPANTSSPIYGSLLPYKSVTVTVTDGSAYRVFDGVVEVIQPDEGRGMNRGRCVIQCMDWLGVLQGYLISLPLQTNKTPNALLRLITSAALRAARATGTISFAATPAVNDSVTIDGVTYTFVDTPANPYDVDRGASAEDAANNLMAAIHVAGAEFITGAYGTSTERHPTVTAEVAEASGASGGTTTIAGSQTTYLSVGKLAGTDSRIAQQFTPATGTLDELHFPMHLGPGTDTVSVTWEVCTDVGGAPGEVLATGTFAPATGTVDVTGIAGPLLSGVNLYWVVLRKVGVTGSEDYTYWEAEYNAGGVTPPTAASKFGGAAWVAQPTYRMPGTQIVTAAVSGAVVTLTAVARGAWGNGITVYAGPNLLTNGDFSDGETGWTFYADGTINHEVTGGKLQVSRDGGTYASFIQNLSGVAVAAGDTVTLKWRAANASAVDNTYNAVTRDTADWDDALIEGYSIEAGTTEATVSWTKVATGSWANTSIEIGGFVDDPTAEVLFDDIELYINGVLVVANYQLSGGADEPAGKIDFATGISTIDIAGDTWSDARTNALSAIQDVIDTECGWFWAARDGTLTFKDQQFTFLLGNQAPALTIDNSHTFHDSAISVRDIINRISVSYIPRGTTLSGVVARSQTVLSVPGRGLIDKGSSNYARWNSTDAITQEDGSRTFTIPFVDVGTGRVVGAQSLVLPLVAGTDFTISEFPDGSGDYTYRGYLKISVALTGQGVEIHCTNTALGTLYIHDFQVRGVALIAYDPLNVVIDDTPSQEDYGRRGYDVTLPLPMSNGDTFAETLARYILSEYAQPLSRVMRAGFQGVTNVGATSLYSIALGDILSVTESQTATSGALGWVTGIAYTLTRDASPSIIFQMMRLSPQNFWVLGDAGYSELGETTWLGM